jgi:VIT1/CCC1 family predicted Fe2+/Mn2+ transporter
MFVSAVVEGTLTTEDKQDSWYSRRHVASKLSEIILGGQDGLVNVAGVILGLAAATDETRIIIAGGLAATFAESISMAAVAYTSTLADRDYYQAEFEQESAEIEVDPEAKKSQLVNIFKNWGFSGQLLEKIVDQVSSDKEQWAAISMANIRKLQPVSSNGLVFDAFLVGISAILGSLVPLAPFFFFPSEIAIWIGLTLTAIVLYALGAIKARLTVGKPYRSGLQMVAIGMVAALAGFVIGLFFKA